MRFSDSTRSTPPSDGAQQTSSTEAIRRSIDLDELEIAPDVIELLDGGFARDLKVLPVRRSGGTFTVAVIEPTKGILLMDQLRKRSRLDIELVIATKVAMATALERYYGAK